MRDGAVSLAAHADWMVIVRRFSMFAARNSNDIEDPIRDFSAGKTIRIPTIENIENMV